MFKYTDLPHWLSVMLPAPAFGHAMLALGLVLAALAWRTRANTRILAGALAFCALAFAWNTAALRNQLAPDPEQTEILQRDVANHLAVETPQRIAGLIVPAGTVVRWRNEDHKNAEVEFPGPSLVDGIPLGGKWSVNEFFWAGTLAEDHTIDGWPCAAGEIYLGVDSHIERCTLAAARTMPTVTIPAGSSIDVSTSHEFDPPVLKTKITLRAQTLDAADSAIIPAGAYLTLYSNGAIEEAEATQAPLQVRGLALESNAFWRYGTSNGQAPPDHTPARYVKGRLAADLQCASRKIPAETWVGIPPHGSSLLVSNLDDSVEPSPIEGCIPGS